MRHSLTFRLLGCLSALSMSAYLHAADVCTDEQNVSAATSDDRIQRPEDMNDPELIGSITPDSYENKPMAAYTSCLYLKDANTWTSAKTYANGIGTGPVTLSTLVSTDLNRVAPAITSTSRRPAVPSGSWKYGFEWESGDQSVQYWIPQGMSHGSVGTTYVAMVSWYYKTDVASPDPNPPVSPYTNKGARVAIANISEATSNVDSHYRLALLVRPTGTGTYEPVVEHAGGLAWVGNYLYMADTSDGMRVFDLANIRQMSTDASCSSQLGKVGSLWCAYGYKYVIPQINAYTPAKADGTALSTSDTCWAKFSWLGKDTTQATSAILSGEYCNNTGSGCVTDPANAPGMGGRLYRWPISASTSKLTLSDTTKLLVKAQKAYTMNKRNVQGAAPVPQTASVDDYRLAASRGNGSLFYVNMSVPWQEYDVAGATWTWIPEGLHASSTGSGNLWTSTEGRLNSSGAYYTNPLDGGRAVFAVDTDGMYP